MNVHEYAVELQVAKWMKRPPCTMIYDPPFYPWLPPEPKVPKVNFDLVKNFNKGQH